MDTMMNMLSPAVLWINSKIVGLLSSEYTLIVLKDEDVPLAPSVKSYNALWVIALCAVCFAARLFVSHVAKRNRLVRRLSALRKQNNVSDDSYSLEISKLEEEIFELENEIASTIGVEA